MPIIIVLFALVAALGFGGYFYTKQSQPEVAVPKVTAIDQSQFAQSTFKDGEYTSTSTYLTPGGSHPNINLSITVKNELVTDVNINFTENNDNESSKFQSKFTNTYKTLVIGKKISDIKLSRVGGASLATGGFNEALLKIEAQAKS